MTTVDTSGSLQRPEGFERQDIKASWFGIGFSLAFTLLIWWAGQFLAVREATF